MVRGIYAKGVVLLLSFLLPAGAIALPTVSERGEAFVAHRLSASPEAYAHCTPQSAQTIGLYTPRLAAIAAEFHRSSVSFAGSPAPPSSVRLLPSIPKALLMALTGFLCVSLVRDRRFWLAALAGLVWTGQAGFAALPRLASHWVGRRPVEQAFTSAADCLSRPEHSYCLRSHVEGTRRAGVLGNLAGVHGCAASWSVPVSGLSSPMQGALERGENHRTPNLSGWRSCLPAASVRIGANLAARQFAMTRLLSCLTRARNCLVSKAGQSVCFSRVCICASLARGPPKQL